MPRNGFDRPMGKKGGSGVSLGSAFRGFAGRFLPPAVRRSVRRRLRRIQLVYGRLTLRGVGRKNFDGSLFDRFSGLQTLFDECRGRSVLDIGCSEGLLAYEFARRGASRVHGFDYDRECVWVAQRIFRDVPVDSAFFRADITRGLKAVARKHGGVPAEQYDIVLFLGVYHHLKRQMPSSALEELVGEILETSGTYLAVRTNLVDEIEGRILASGFRVVYRSPEPPPVRNLGALRMYRRG